MTLDMNEMLILLGSKEMEIHLLRRQVSILKDELAKAKKPEPEAPKLEMVS